MLPIFFTLIIDRDNQVSRKIFVSLHLFSFSFGTNSTFTFALGSFFSIIQILSQWKNRKKKKLDFNHRSIIYFLKFGGSSNYCVFFHTFRKVRILFIISTAAAKNLVFFHEMLLVVAEALRFVFISRYQFFLKFR